MKLSKHFTLEEMTVSQTAVRKGINNNPRATALSNLKWTCRNMEYVRTHLHDLPIFVSSGYRSPALNKAIGGARTSAHTKGFAVDFRCPGFGTPYQVAKALAEEADRQETFIEFDQLISEFGRWVHISFDRKMRGKVMTAKKVRGKTVYSLGINK